MAYVLQPYSNLYYVDDSVVALYVTAGWVQATAGDVATWAAYDAYGGQQGAPPAPALLSPILAPAPKQQAD